MRYVNNKADKEEEELQKQLQEQQEKGKREGKEKEKKREKKEKKKREKKKKGKAGPKKQPILNPDAEKARKELEEGGPLTLGHFRVVGYLVKSSIKVFDEKEELLDEIGDNKPGEPISLRVIQDKNGGFSHVEPLNLTPEQKEQYESLDHTKYDCLLNALFVYLPKEQQQELRGVEGMRKVSADHMREHPKRYNDLFKYQENLSQLAPSEVPRVGRVSEWFNCEYLDIRKELWSLERDLALNKNITPEQKRKR